MNAILKGNWDEIENLVQQAWFKLTSDDLREIAENQRTLFDKLQERYGFTPKQAKRAIDNFNLMLKGEQYQL